MMMFIRKFVGWVMSGFLAVWAVVKVFIDWIGRSTLPEDWSELVTEKLPSWAAWLFSTPSWVPALLAATLTGFLIYISWPRKPTTSSSNENTKGAPDSEQVYPGNVESESPKEASVDESFEMEPRFGFPRHDCPESNVTILLINVYFGRRFHDRLSKSKVPNCRIRLINKTVFSKEQPIELRWQSANSPNGVDTITLEEGVVFPVHIAIKVNKALIKARKYAGIADGKVRLLSAAVLRDGHTDIHIIEGRYSFGLQIESETQKWESTNTYTLHAPASFGNDNTFAIEVND